MKLRLIYSCSLAAIVAVAAGCGTTGGYNLPPASRLMEPGPGVGGPGPGVMAMPTPGVRPAQYQAPIAGPGIGAVQATEVQVLFGKPEAMQVSFDTSGSYDSTPLVTPARQNFMQGGIYRLKVMGVPGREGTELYPTLEVGPPTRGTAAYLAHNAIPVQFTEEDFDQVLSGNFVTKVIYLPEPGFQELALAGVETLVSTRLDPGLDPIVEADRRGSILAVIRVGNKDMEVPGGSSVTPMYGAAQPAAGVVPANYAAPVQSSQPAPYSAAYAAPTQAVGAGVAPIATSGGAGQVAQTSLGCASCDDAGCVNGNCGLLGGGGGAGCQSCGGGCPVGGCLAGLVGGLTPGTAAGYYGPNSSPRGGHGPGGMPPGLMGSAGWGMPITGTPIGLPGPPHVPLGVPAGLKKHVMRNWTSRHIPDPVSKMQINVKQRPGLSYPQPPTRVWVNEDTIHSAPHYSSRHFGAQPSAGGLLGGIAAGGGGGAPCPDGSCAPTGGGGLLGGMKSLIGH